MQSNLAFGYEDKGLRFEFEDEIFAEIKNAIDKDYLVLAATEIFNY